MYMFFLIFYVYKAKQRKECVWKLGNSKNSRRGDEWDRERKQGMKWEWREKKQVEKQFLEVGPDIFWILFNVGPVSTKASVDL